ncbi:MAG: trimeric intracellular cation channel family protein, partial [Actinomycetes bacterium]
FFHPGVARIERAVLLLDAVGLGLFAVAGTLKALALGTTPLTAVIVGVITGVGGGVLRDLLAGEQPRLFAEREWYATPALLGVTIFALADSADLSGPATTWGCVVLIAGLRILGFTRGWQVPAPRPPRA